MKSTPIRAAAARSSPDESSAQLALCIGLGRPVLSGSILGATVSAAAPSPPATSQAEHVSHGRFQNVAVYAPIGTPKSFVLFLSGDGGWNRGAEDIARQLVRHGAMVAGIDLPKLDARFRSR